MCQIPSFPYFLEVSCKRGVNVFHSVSHLENHLSKKKPPILTNQVLSSIFVKRASFSIIFEIKQAPHIPTFTQHFNAMSSNYCEALNEVIRCCGSLEDLDLTTAIGVDRSLHIYC